ncbi:ADP-ribosylglycohydrolase family protein [Flavobacteriaceae bacterium F89]|uniref:ADP-ribosylglycohydrolase family protein n=1 Tax=Cerina litoralis TaxID=2874477 RepID=A0AAE3EY44_9FLAO|nr:ADP-ribosylglycohydrolase family protein [Cerina litoralis]MCG2462499.1 ADP-ribosylglycohydrolase family protein [Cerina litoralis]
MNTVFFKLFGVFVALSIITSCREEGNKREDKEKVEIPNQITITKKELLNKVKGGWAGQTIGVTFGGPYEFRYNGTMIQDYVQLEWNDDQVSWYFDNAPGLYDDLYMDLTFVDVLEKHGLDAPIEDFANAFAHADYPLWHANQAARYNILNGIKAPISGHWQNSLHADDIDFQIEADFAGLMSPGMINSATEICERVGHIMNYGDGFYAGAYVASMYSLAFVSNDVDFVVNEALNAIPKESKYYKAMKDVIGFHKKFPNDWKQAWFEIERSKWAEDLHCPDGVFLPFNIDATVNSAYVLLGLLYGQGDFYKSIDIATRAGQDADCNPSTVAGILGTMLGYDKIPDYWLKPLKAAEDRDFIFTTYSLNKTYKTSFRHALQLIKKNGGNVDGETITINCQKPKTLPLEVGFPNVFPEAGKLKESTWDARFTMKDDKIVTLAFSGTGIVIKGAISGLPEDFVGELEVTVDGKADRVMKLPVDFKTRSLELYTNLELPKGEHQIKLKWLNPRNGGTITSTGYIAFSDEIKTANHNKQAK